MLQKQSLVPQTPWSTSTCTALQGAIHVLKCFSASKLACSARTDLALTSEVQVLQKHKPSNTDVLCHLFLYIFLYLHPDSLIISRNQLKYQKTWDDIVYRRVEMRNQEFLKPRYVPTSLNHNLWKLLPFISHKIQVLVHPSEVKSFTAIL